MSKRVQVTELREIRRRLSAGYVPVPPRSLPSWVADWHQGLEKVHYLKPGKFAIADTLGSLVKLRGGVHVRGPLAFMAKPDIERIWEDFVARDLRAYHAIEDRESGFDFHFAAIDGFDQYVTGTVTVIRIEGT